MNTEQFVLEERKEDRLHRTYRIIIVMAGILLLALMTMAHRCSIEIEHTKREQQRLAGGLMGIKIFSDNFAATRQEKQDPPPPMPNPKKFELLDIEGINGWSIALVNYPGSTTYGGNKLLVYAAPPGVVRTQTLLDPHFLEREDRLSPVARLEPTLRGKHLAQIICQQRPR